MRSGYLVKWFPGLKDNAIVHPFRETDDGRKRQISGVIRPVSVIQLAVAELITDKAVEELPFGKGLQHAGICISRNRLVSIHLPCHESNYEYFRFRIIAHVLNNGRRHDGESLFVMATACRGIVRAVRRHIAVNQFFLSFVARFAVLLDEYIQQN